MDAFFASVEQRDNPQYRAKPVVVGSDPKGGSGRGVVSTCSYEARKFGIHSAMPISIAYKKCPHAVFLPVDMEKYSAVSHEIYGILYGFTPDIEPISIDEAFLDITGSYRIFGTPLKTCMEIKSKIRQVTGLTASVGLAPTKMAAKIASDLKKPDGMVVVTEEGLLEFLRPLDVRKIWGLGPKCEEALNAIGIRTIGDLARTDVKALVKALGKTGADFWELANGIDGRPVEPSAEAKSVSNELTFDKDTADKVKIGSSIMWLCEKVSARLRDDGVKGRTITLKVRLEGFDTYTRAVTIAIATNLVDTIYQEARRLYDTFMSSTPPRVRIKGRKVRLLGVKVSNLSDAAIKESLFDGYGDEKKECVHKAVDSIKHKFGGEAIFRAGGRA
jgi:nucleotidyltransferase/DNA polymerase involved in DNA repair